MLQLRPGVRSCFFLMPYSRQWKMFLLKVALFGMRIFTGSITTLVKWLSGHGARFKNLFMNWTSSALLNSNNSVFIARNNIGKSKTNDEKKTSQHCHDSLFSLLFFQR